MTFALDRMPLVSDGVSCLSTFGACGLCTHAQRV